MYCVHCRKSIPEDAAFCAYCGKSVSVGQSQPTASEPFWEQCEITEGLDGSHVYYWADSIGEKGRFNAGESPRWSGSPGVAGLMAESLVSGMTFGLIDPIGSRHKATERAAGDALKELVRKLVEDGWQPLPERGERPYQLQFRRHA